MLTDTQKNAVELLKSLYFTAMQAPPLESATAVRRAAAYAYALKKDLGLDGHKITFDKKLVSNRGLSPDDPLFFEQVHCIQDLLSIVYTIAAAEDLKKDA